MKKHLYKITFTIIMCFSILLLTSNYISAEASEKPQAINGILDLTNWNWEQDETVSLDGEWEFYWQELLTPNDFHNLNGALQKELLTVPRAWNTFVIDGEELSGDGYATYRLLIYNSSEQILGIKIPRIFTSYNLWVNGKLIASNGNVSPEKDKMIPQYLPKVKYIKPEGDTIELVIQVANFRHRSGGILESIHMGTEGQISQMRTSNLALELFLFGSVFIIGLYHLALYGYRTKDKSTLIFGVYSILISLRTILVGEIYFINLFPYFNWEAAHKIQTLAYYLGVPLIVMFLKAIYPADVSTKINRIVQVIGGSFALLVLLTPAKVFTQFNPLYQVFSLLVVPYIIYVIFNICYKKREGSYFIGTGLFILIIFTINDIIFLSILIADSDNHFLRSIITRGNMSSWGLLIFVFSQSLVLAQKFSGSFSRVELLTKQLQQLNVGLEGKVKERTLALENSKKELEKAYLAVSRLEKSRQDLVQNISHDLRTPLTAIQGYVNAILDGLVEEPHQQQKYLKRVTEKVNNLNYMVQELMDLAQLEARQSILDFKPVSINSLITSLTNKHSLDMMNAKVTFKVNYPPSWQDDTFKSEHSFVVIDTEKLDRVFTNLFSNALKYTPEGGRIELSFDCTADNKNLLIEISDTGVGISRDDLPHIFERFYMVSKARQDNDTSSGLGLAIAKEIVEYHDGEIWVKSEIDKGSSFFFTLPIHDKTKVIPDLMSG